MNARLGLLALALLGCLAAAPAQAQTVSVGRIRGHGGRVVQRRLEAGLVEAGFTESDTPELRVTGRVRQRGRRYVLSLELSRAGDVGRVRRQARTPAALIEAAVSEIRMLVPPPPPEPPSEPEPVPEPPPPAAATEPPPREAPAVAPRGRNPLDDAQDALEVGVGFGVVGRAHAFGGDQLDQIGSYRLDGAPILAARATWFPLMHFTSDPLLRVGIRASAWTALALSTERSGVDPTEAGIETTMHEETIGLLYRLTVSDLVTIEPSFDYAQTVFRLAAPGPQRNGERVEAVPDVEYRQLRPRVAVELALPEGLSARADVAWLAVLSAGRLDDADWFPRSTTNGVELGAAVSWRFDRWFAARVYFAHARYVSALNSEPDDQRLAGLAVDEWTRGGVELSFVVPGTP